MPAIDTVPDDGVKVTSYHFHGSGFSAHLDLKPSTSPCSTCRDISFTAFIASKFLLKFFTSIYEVIGFLALFAYSMAF